MQCVHAGMNAASQNYASAARSVLAMWLSLNLGSVQRREPISLATVVQWSVMQAIAWAPDWVAIAMMVNNSGRIEPLSL
jgi:hypothetical protein